MGLFKGKPDTIPVVVSDFVFSAIAEEMGALFAICLILVYFSCFLMFINISLQLVKPFYKLVAMGLSTSYGIQLFLCIGGVTKLIPHTGCYDAVDQLRRKQCIINNYNLCSHPGALPAATKRGAYS